MSYEKEAATPGRTISVRVFVLVVHYANAFSFRRRDDSGFNPSVRSGLVGFFKDLEIEEVDPNYVDPDQLKLIPDSETTPVNQPAAPAANAAPPGAITRPGKLTVKDIRYIEEFLAKRVRAC